MKIPSPEFLIRATREVALRFPATLLVALVGVFSVIRVIELRLEDNDSSVLAWLIAQLGLALCTGLVALAESKNWSPARTIGLQVAGLAALIGYFFYLGKPPKPDTLEFAQYFGLVVTAHLFVAFAPYLNRLPVGDFWEYNKRLFANFVVGAVYTFILYAGLALAILAVDQLFDLNVHGEIYAELFVVLAGLFNTIFFLYHFPAGFRFEEQEKAHDAVFINLCQYILIPISALYFLILYAYSFKILLSWELPHGWVSSLVLGFSVAGIFTYLLNFMLPEYTGKPVLQFYRRWFWVVLLPLTALLFVAIGRRISEYGVTEERYYVAHTGIWLLALCIYFIWSKKDNIKFIPISLAAFVLFAVWGPFSAFDVSRRSQTAVLQEMFEKYGRFKDGKLSPSDAAVPTEEAGRMQSILYYLERHEQLDGVREWLPADKTALLAEPLYDGNKESLLGWLGIEANPVVLEKGESRSVAPPNPPASISVAGFRTYYSLQLYAQSEPRENQLVWLSTDGGKIVLRTASNTPAVDSFDLTPAMRQWMSIDTAKSYEIILDDPAINLTGKKLKGRLIVHNARFATKKPEMESLEGVLLIK